MEKEIKEHIDNDPGMREDIELLRSIPGIGNSKGVRPTYLTVGAAQTCRLAGN